VINAQGESIRVTKALGGSLTLSHCENKEVKIISNNYEAAIPVRKEIAAALTLVRRPSRVSRRLPCHRFSSSSRRNQYGCINIMQIPIVQIQYFTTKVTIATRRSVCVWSFR
jgi:hypothetical protein